MIYPITKYGAAVLESPTKPVEKFDDELAKLCEDMFESMYVAQGVGLAATQIGLSKRLAVIDVSLGKIPRRGWCLRIPRSSTWKETSAKKKGACRCPDSVEMCCARPM